MKRLKLTTALFLMLSSLLFLAYSILNAGGFTEAPPQPIFTTSAPTFATVNTGQGANELYDMDQNVLQASAVTFATVDTGLGANELYDMNQNVQTTDEVTFKQTTSTYGVVAATGTFTGAVIQVGSSNHSGIYVSSGTVADTGDIMMKFWGVCVSSPTAQSAGDIFILKGTTSDNNAYILTISTAANATSWVAIGGQS